MRTTRLFFLILLLIMVLVPSFTKAQTKIVTVIQNDDSVTVFVDTLDHTNKAPMAFFFDDDLNNVQETFDSIMQANSLKTDSVMNMLTFQLDSLGKSMSMFAFDLDDDILQNVIPSDSAFRKMMNVTMNMETDTLDDGRIVKKVIAISGDDGSEHQVIQKGDHYVIRFGGDGNEEEELIWNDESNAVSNEIISSVPLSDIHLLKKAGFSADLLTSKPLTFKKENINVNRKRTNDTDALEIEIKATLPSKGKVTVTLIDKNGKKTDEENFKSTDKINISYKLDSSSAPYFILVMQNKKLWSRKIDF